MNMTLELREPFLSLWQGKDPFVEVERLQGRIYRAMPGRRTLRTEIDGRAYFVKIHHGVGWLEIGKNLITGKPPVLGARQEWLALRRLRAAKVPTMTAVAFGERGKNPARRQSFLITEEIAPAIDLETLTQNWQTTPPVPARKYALIAAVGKTVAAMHQAGVNHRDCYLCHFLLREGEAHCPPSPALIDLHRAQVRAATPRRWRDKDLAALWFSALNIGLTRRDKLRFLRAYFDKPLHAILREEAGLLIWLEKKAARLMARFQKYEGKL
ncbi:MAG: lipopolysaccharide core heptose(I) kinase RfaP [Zoogloeaceae bacterium]|jgi:heptose I phosphotransferase|nr:lipopolysaccharide core heptose(I) kinase RfaP [Zoogloeaceae bacterium]